MTSKYDDGDPAEVFESYPDPIQRLLDARKEQTDAIPPEVRGFVLETPKLWTNASTVTVAFNGGSDDLRGKIESAAHEWTNYANLTLEFRNDDGAFRTWSRQDTEFSADIRISFNYAGYWSMVGTDSVELMKPSHASMNFSGFTTNLPSSWRKTVLHEFGHALGLHHEHQNPAGHCDQEFRWEDDPGYVRTRDMYGQFTRDAQQRRPGLYTRLGGPPNNWDRETVDHNLRQLPYDGKLISDPDRKSIMFYQFAPWMFKRGAQSPCYVGPNTTLSAGDKQAMREAYPGKGSEARKFAIKYDLHTAADMLSKTTVPHSLWNHVNRLAESFQALEWTQVPPP